jgi:serine/threonine-protein kinase
VPVVEPAPVADPPPAASTAGQQPATPVVVAEPVIPDSDPPVDVAAAPPSGGTLELVLPGVGNASAPPSSVEGFLSGFDGGDCFFARPLVADAGAAHIEGFGAAVEGFQRLESSYMKDFSAEPQIDVRLVSAAQCPAVAFMDALGAGRLGRSMITLESYAVGGAVPLSGRITGVGGRSLSVLLVGDDGTVARLDPYLERTADGARFSIPLQADGASDGVPQLLIALVTDAPINGLPDSGPAAALFADLSRAFAGASSGVSADAAMFKVGGR